MGNPVTETGAVTVAGGTNKDTDSREREGGNAARCLQIGTQMAYLLGPNTCSN